MKQHAHLLILTIMFLTSCSDDTEVMKQESSPPSLTEKAPTYRTKENAIIEVELFINLISATLLSSHDTTVFLRFS